MGAAVGQDDVGGAVVVDVGDHQAGDHARRPVAGTFDCKVLWGAKRWITLVDLKTGTQKRRAHRVQLQLYKRFPVNKDVQKMCTIYAQQDGSQAVVEWVVRSAEDEAWALNAINVLIGRSYGY